MINFLNSKSISLDYPFMRGCRSGQTGQITIKKVSPSLGLIIPKGIEPFGDDNKTPVSLVLTGVRILVPALHIFDGMFAHLLYRMSEE